MKRETCPFCTDILAIEANINLIIDAKYCGCNLGIHMNDLPIVTPLLVATCLLERNSLFSVTS